MSEASERIVRVMQWRRTLVHAEVEAWKNSGVVSVDVKNEVWNDEIEGKDIFEERRRRYGKIKETLLQINKCSYLKVYYENAFSKYAFLAKHRGKKMMSSIIFSIRNC